MSASFLNPSAFQAALAGNVAECRRFMPLMIIGIIVVAALALVLTAFLIRWMTNGAIDFWRALGGVTLIALLWWIAVPLLAALTAAPGAKCVAQAGARTLRSF